MKGSVYVIRSHQTEDVYYGSTTQMLCKRMATHRQDYKKWLRDAHGYMTSFKLLKYDDAYIELVEEVEFQNKKELHAREGFYIRNNECVNKCVMGRTHKEYIKDNEEYFKEYMTKFREDNKEEIKDQRRLYNEEHKEEQTEYKKKYNKDNKDVVRERERKYYEANKDKINEQRREAYLKKKSVS